MTSATRIELAALSRRIKELGDKSTQVLVFLSFVLVIVAPLARDKPELRDAMRYWLWALCPVLLGIVPLKEVCWECRGWYQFLRGLKFGLLWTATILIGLGLRKFVSGF